MAVADDGSEFFRRYHFDKWAFLAIFLVGGVAIVIFDSLGYSKIVAVSVCVGLMLFYAGAALWLPALRLKADQAADNCYYMGLLYTLTSLGVALFRFASSDVASQSILRNFGIAIFTTIAGLTLRVFISQFREDPEDLEFEAKAALATTVRQLRADLEQSIAEIQRFSTGARQALYETLRTTNTAITDAASNFTEGAAAFNRTATTLGKEMERAVDATRSFANRVAAVDISPGLVTDGLRPTFEVFRQTMRAFSSGLESERAKVVSILDALAKLAGAVGELEGVTKTFARASTHLRDSVGSVGEGVGAVGRLNDAIASAARGADAFTLKLDRAADMVDQQAGKTMGRLGQTVRTIGERSGGALDEVDAAARRVAQTMANLDAEFGGSGETIERVRRELTELAAWIIERLDRRP